MADKINNLLSGVLLSSYAKSYYLYHSAHVVKEKKKPSALPKNKRP